jgi:hypothetical protein
MTIGVTQVVLLRQPYTAPLPKGLPPLTPLADVPRAEMLVAKNGQARLGDYVATLAQVIDIRTMRGCDGTGKPLSAAEVKSTVAKNPGMASMGSLVIFRVKGPRDVDLQEEWRTGFKEPRSGTSMGSSSDGRELVLMSSSIIEGESAKIRISIRTSDQVPVAYIGCQMQGESNGFRYRMIKGTPRYEVMKTSQVSATFQIDKPADLKGVKLSFENGNNPDFFDADSFEEDDFGMMGSGVLKQGTIHGSSKDGVYGMVMASRVNTIDFKVPRP